MREFANQREIEPARLKRSKKRYYSRRVAETRENNSNVSVLRPSENFWCLEPDAHSIFHGSLLYPRPLFSLFAIERHWNVVPLPHLPSHPSAPLAEVKTWFERRFNPVPFSRSRTPATEDKFIDVAFYSRAKSASDSFARLILRFIYNHRAAKGRPGNGS